MAIDAFTPRGEVRGLNNRRFHTAFDSSGRQLSLFDANLRQAVYCVGAAAAIPRFEIAEPIRAILSWFMRENGRQLIHAAAVGEPGGGVLLIGRSGAGKSNTALVAFYQIYAMRQTIFAQSALERTPRFIVFTVQAKLMNLIGSATRSWPVSRRIWTPNDARRQSIF